MNSSKKMVSIGKAADMLGVCLDTLREWDKEGKIVPVKTPGNHRRYLYPTSRSFKASQSRRTRPMPSVSRSSPIAVSVPMSRKPKAIWSGRAAGC